MTLSPLYLAGKTALVTGGSRGIGLAIAERLASKGCSIILVSRSKELLEHNISRVLPQIETTQKHSYITCDLSQPEEVHSILAAAKGLNKELKKASILINGAGVSQSSLLASTPVSKVTEIINTNLTSTIVVTQALVRTLLRNKPSSIINISSVLGLKGRSGTAVYGASKAGLVGFTQAMAVELGGKDIRVNSISPGLVLQTRMGESALNSPTTGFQNALPREGVEVKDIVSGVEFLLANDSITGQNLVIDAGYIC